MMDNRDVQAAAAQGLWQQRQCATIRLAAPRLHRVHAGAAVFGSCRKGASLPSDCYLTNALSDFGNALSFATDPVFGLPDGYSANSADASILGNLYAMPVPEPACGALAALGLVIVAGRAWRRSCAVPTAAAVLPLMAVPPTQKRSSGVPPGRNDFLYASVFETANLDCSTAHRFAPQSHLGCPDGPIACAPGYRHCHP